MNQLHIPDELIALIATPIVGGFLIAITAIITYHKRTMQRDDMEATLKMEMLERGMSAEDIERVLGARMGGGPRRSFRFEGFRGCQPQRSSLK